MDWLKRWISDTTVITAITPMMIPNVVRKLRSLWARMAYIAERRLSIRAYIALLVTQGVDGVERRRFGGRRDTEYHAYADGEAEGEHHRPDGHVRSLEGGNQLHHQEADAIAQCQPDESSQ